MLGGMMEKAGMPRFDDVLSSDDVYAIQAFILEQANQDYDLRYHRNWWTETKQWTYDKLAQALKSLAELQ